MVDKKKSDIKYIPPCFKGFIIIIQFDNEYLMVLLKPRLFPV